jgi:AhpD family alkylhydroperoxidase
MTDTNAGAAATTPRILPVQEVDADLATRMEKIPKGADGRPLNLFGTLAHRPRVMSLCNALGGRLMFDSVIGDRERELVILRAAAHARCGYEIRAHHEIGLQVGLTEQEIAAALDVGSAPQGSVADVALLRVADEVSTEVDVSDEAWAALDGVLDDDDARVELIVVIGFYRMLAGLLNGARVAGDPAFTPPPAPTG